MSVIHINNITNKDGTSGPTISGISTVSSTGFMKVPVGDTFKRNVVENVVKDGLVLYLDAGNDISYSGIGSSWTDLSIQGNNATLINGPTYSSSNGGSIVFDGVNDYFTTSLSTIGNANTSFTWGAFVRINASTGSNFFLLGNYTQNYTDGFFAIAFNDSGTNTFIYIRDSTLSTEVKGTSKSLSLNTWYYLIGVRDASANQIRFYVNGVLESTNTFSGSLSVKSSTNNFGGINHLSNCLNANLSSVVVYNKALSTSEVQQNFNALRSRYGL